MVFKYTDIITEVVSEHGCTCPPADALQVTRQTFRYIHEIDKKGISHLPNKKRSPKRVLSTPDENCSVCGISCYDSADNAIANYRELLKTSPLIYKNIGDSLAVGTIDETSGVQTEIDEKGHFDLFEFETFDPAATFVFLQRLIENNGTN